jgi:hypothetical protein
MYVCLQKVNDTESNIKIVVVNAYLSIRRQQHDRLAITVKYSQSNLYFISEWRLKINCRNYTVLYVLLNVVRTCLKWTLYGQLHVTLYTCSSILALMLLK